MMLMSRIQRGPPSTSTVISSRIEINAISRKVYRKPRVCFGFKVSFRLTSTHINASANKLIAVSTRKYMSVIAIPLSFL